MAKQKSKVAGLVKDAAILTIITLIAGFTLAMINGFTQGPIAEQKVQKKMKAYKEVFPEAKSFDDNDTTKKMVAETAKFVGDNASKFGKTGLEEVMEAKDDSGKTIGYVATAYSDEGYGGRVKVSLGYNLEKKVITKIAILEANETPGLGAKISTDWNKQFDKGKPVKQFEVVKRPVQADNEIEAISGATISSRAVTYAVDTALLVFEGGAK